MDILRSVRPNILGIAPYVAGTRAASHQGKSIKLASNENAWGSSPLALAAIRSVIDQGLAEYPDSHQTDLREATARFWQARGADISSSQIVCGDGSGEVLSMLMDVFLSPGDSIVVPEKSFILYNLIASRQDAKIIEVPRRYFNADTTALARASQDARVILLANPDNPTAGFLDKQAILELMGAVPSSCIVLLDEAYIHFAGLEHSLTDCIQQYPNLVVSHTFSKAYGLAALRVGYAILHPALAAQMQKIRLPFNLGLFQQVGAIAALSDNGFLEDTVRRTQAGRDKLVKSLEKLGLKVPVNSRANFIMADLGSEDSPVYQHLTDHGISIRNLASFGYTARYARITIGREDEMDYLIKVLSEN